MQNQVAKQRANERCERLYASSFGRYESYIFDSLPRIFWAICLFWMLLGLHGISQLNPRPRIGGLIAARAAAEENVVLRPDLHPLLIDFSIAVMCLGFGFKTP